MNFIKSKDNINKKTKVMGVIFGKLANAIPLVSKWINFFILFLICIQIICFFLWIYMALIMITVFVNWILCKISIQSLSFCQDENQACLWTEWFDVDTPCNSRKWYIKAITVCPIIFFAKSVIVSWSADQARNMGHLVLNFQEYWISQAGDLSMVDSSFPHW